MFLLKVLILRKMKDLMFQMGKEQQLLLHHSVRLTAPPLLPTLRMSSHALICLPPPKSSSLCPLPPLIRRSFSHHPLWRLLPLACLTWSAACLLSGGCRTRASTHVSSVSHGQRMAASSMDELATSCLVTPAPESWRRGISCVQCADCPSRLSSSPTSAETQNLNN